MGRVVSADRRSRRAPPVVVLALVASFLPAVAEADLAVAVNAPAGAPSDSLSGGDSAPLVATFRLSGLLDDESSQLGEGVPATLTLVVDLWGVRDGWWDSLVASQNFSYRFRRDPGGEKYLVQDPDREMVEIRDRAALRTHLERPHEIALGQPEEFARGDRFYLVVTATVRPLNLDDLEEIDAWLSGDVAGRQGGGLLGIPRALAGIVVDLSGLGDRSAAARSRTFVPNP